MNLEFVPVKDVSVDGQPYTLQLADVTKNRNFWAAWNHACNIRKEAQKMNAKIGHTLLDSVVSLTKAGDKWIAYRLISQSGDLKSFSLSYILKNVSGLLPYQPRAVSHLCNAIVTKGAAADGSDTGLGKTYHAVAVARELGLVPLVLCRVAGVAGWQRAFARFKVPYLDVVTWEYVRLGKLPYLSRRQNRFSGKWEFNWKLPLKSILIFDEAHLGNHHTSQNHGLWTASCGTPSLSLSATFADKPERIGGLSKVLGMFRDGEFEQWLKARGLFVNRYNQAESIDPVNDMKAINRLLYPAYGYRLSYDDPEVKKMFPERVTRALIIDLGKQKTSTQNALYEKLIEEVKRLHGLGTSAQANKLNADLRYRQMTELLKADTLVNMTTNLIAEGKSVCIFVNFRATLQYLARRLHTSSVIYGNQERDGISRERVRREFHEDRTRLIICMSDAGGQSIDLHDIQGRYPRVSLICPTYNPITLKQVLGRTYRAMTRSVPVMLLVYAAGTVEEKVAENVNEKIANINALNDGDLMEPDLFGLISGSERNSEL